MVSYNLDGVGSNLFCAAAPGTIKVIIAVVPTVTTTNRTTGTTISVFVAPVLDWAGRFPHKAGVLFFTERGSVQ